MNIEKILMMIKKMVMIKRIVIAFVIFLVLLVIGRGCYRSFRLPEENENIEVKIDGLQDKIENIPEIAREDYLLFLDQLEDDEKEAFRKKKVDRKNLKKNIETLKEQGIWDGLYIEPESEVDFEKYYCSLQDSQKAFRLRLDRLLKKVEKEKDLASFREELEKLRQERKKYIDVFAEFGYRIQEETKEPMPFFATWIGLGISVAISLIVSLIIVVLLRKNNNFSECLLAISISFLIIHLLSQLLIFPLINCLLSLKMSSFKETYKHYSSNKFKNVFLYAVPLAFLLGCMIIIYSIKCIQKKCPKSEEEIKEEAINKYKSHGFSKSIPYPSEQKTN